jgi:hypothetical protein
VVVDGVVVYNSAPHAFIDIQSSEFLGRERNIKNGTPGIYRYLVLVLIPVQIPGYLG